MALHHRCCRPGPHPHELLVDLPSTADGNEHEHVIVASASELKAARKSDAFAVNMKG